MGDWVVELPAVSASPTRSPFGRSRSKQSTIKPPPSTRNTDSFRSPATPIIMSTSSCTFSSTSSSDSDTTSFALLLFTLTTEALARLLLLLLVLATADDGAGVEVERAEEDEAEEEEAAVVELYLSMKRAAGR